MNQQTQADHALTAVIVVLIVIVFVLDLLTPLGIVIWVLYVIPLGVTTWSSIRRLLPISVRYVTIFVTRLGGKGKERTGKDRTNRTLQANEIATNLGKPLQ